MKRRRNPPPRLEWPAPGPLSLSNQNPIPASSGSFQKQFHDIKRSTIKKQFTIKKHREALHKIDNDNMMWIEKYAFIDDAKDLCVQNRKVDEVRTWMKSALRACYRSSADYTRNVDDNVSKLLLLVGSPGIGKSTMCRVLAKELGLDLLEWNDATTSTSTSCSYSTYGADNSLFSSSYQSPLSSFEEFLQSAGTGCNSLDLSSSVYQNEEKRIENTSSKKGAMLFIEDMPNLHSSDAEKKFKHTMEQHIHTSRFPTILIFSNVSEGKAAPSDLEKLIPSSVLYNSNKVKIIQCNSVTQSKMKKCLGMIAQKERIFIPNGLLELIHTNSGGDLRNAIMTLQFQLVGRNQYSSRVQMKNPKRITNLHETNNNAIKRGAQFDRDVKLSAFHALGKLLYAKRQINTNKDTGSFHSSERPPLQFIPEEVVNSCDMSLEGMVSFLSYHCPDFYTSEMDLSEAFELFSDTVLLLDRTYDVSLQCVKVILIFSDAKEESHTIHSHQCSPSFIMILFCSFQPQRDQSDKTFPSAYISSLAGRTVAYTNKNPTPNKFRSLEAPKVYDVLRKKKWNDIKINQLCKRLSLSVETSGNNEEEEYSNSMLPLNASIGSSSRFVTDYLPFMRIIHPNGAFHLLLLSSHVYSEIFTSS